MGMFTYMGCPYPALLWTIEELWGILITYDVIVPFSIAVLFLTPNYPVGTKQYQSDDQRITASHYDSSQIAQISQCVIIALCINAIMTHWEIIPKSFCVISQCLSIYNFVSTIQYVYKLFFQTATICHDWTLNTMYSDPVPTCTQLLRIENSRHKLSIPLLTPANNPGNKDGLLCSAIYR